ncbi:Proline--tRNA ligase [Rickettsiales bacterium Ac37b]|nr:Proline--tRNA ligase [Rickettsiales bacterium Ac37b]
MRLSNYFLPIIKENPQEASIISHRLMLRAGMIRQLTSGIYNWLPLGMNVLSKISNIIRSEMNKMGSLEILMPSIQPAELWQESGRYNDYGKEMLCMKDRHERNILFGPTHEEVVTDIFRHNVKSYRDLPKNLYQIQWKFRDEIRPRFGVMRGREFLMKDAYSFDLDFVMAKETYNLFYKTYFKIFKALGLNAIAVSADSGAIGGNLSHEFHIIADTGESAIFYDSEFDTLVKDNTLDIDRMHNLYAAADEKHDPSNCPIPDSKLSSKRGIEVGHVFYFGNKYSKAMNAYVINSKGEQVPVEMGSYGIGVSRLVGAIIEANYDDIGIIWPEQIAPFYISLINLRTKDAECTKLAESVYQTLLKNNVEVIYDDSEQTAGSKFATHDLIGIPWQIIIGPKGAKYGKAELKNRKTMSVEELSIEALLNKLKITR